MFRRLIRFLSRRWVLIAIGLLAFILLIWFAGPLIAVADYKPLEPVFARVLVLTLIPVVWLLTRFRVRFTDRRTEKRLAQELAASTEAGHVNPKGADAPDAEQGMLAERLKAALQTLQTAKLSRGRKLYQLPWYVLIGAPGSGKTTALKQSGLHFPLQSQLGTDPVQGAGGTRYCDWWFTDEAVFIDTAGRYTTQDNPQDGSSQAWLGFLGMLKRSRPRRPLNGVVVTVSILDLLNKTATQHAHQASAIKRRIQELNSHLGMELPVYLLFTKCDLIAGFSEFFVDLEQQEREQIWGCTLPLDAAGTEQALTVFSVRFQELLARANDRVLKLLQTERNVRRRSLIFGFPRQMLSLEKRIESFLQVVFAPNQFEQAAILRGVYFVSGTQTPGAANWANGVLPPELCTPPVSSSAVTAPKSFFITRLLHDVIFAEAALATANRRARRRFRWAFSAALGVISLLFVGGVTAWAVSYNSNTLYLDELSADVERIKEQAERTPSGQQRSWWFLAQNLDQLKALPTGYQQGADKRPIRRTFGLYQGHKIGTQARNTYLNALERTFMPALGEELLHQLDLAGTQEEYLYEALRIYLMFYHPEKMDHEAVQTWLAIIWNRSLPGEDNASIRHSLREHLQVALTENLLPPQMDEQRVLLARETLTETPLERRLYLRLKSKYLTEHEAEFNLVDVLGRRTAEALFTRRSGKSLSAGVPGFYSYRGFHRGFNQQKLQLGAHLAQERWVYGGEISEELTEEELKALSQHLENYYFSEYIAHWSEFLEDLAINSFRTARDGRELSRVLAGRDAPLVKLAQAIRQHTALSELPAAADSVAEVADKLADKAAGHERRRLEQLLPGDMKQARLRLPGQEVADKFEAFNEYVAGDEGKSLEQLQGAFSQLNQYFENLLTSDDVRRSAFAATLNPNQNAAALREVRLALSPAPDVIKGWFSSLSGDSQRITSAAAYHHVNAAWRVEVVDFYQRMIAGRYPVDAGADQEIRIDDFIQFFGPAGILDEFFMTYVQPFADTSGGQWRWRRNVGMSNQTLRFFQHAKRIQQAYFTGSGEFRVDFTIKPYSLDPAVVRSLLEVGGHQVTYQHGPVRSSSVQWAAEGGDRARLVFNLASRGTPLSTSEEGQWGWLRLLDRHALIKPLSSGNGLLVTFDLQGLRTQYELWPQSGINPFAQNDVRNFSLPSRL